ncbi:MAG: sigma-54-dependent Fis family transcriptional regulator [Deltaproteobacteria bacterium]|nr:sigma-54-dependent Fis family transcriptional regulator [Deltaproteobacteria bacterium]
MTERLLFIDDDLNFLNSLSNVVELHHHTLFKAPHLNEGLDILKHHPIDLLFIDVGLGAESGILAVKAMKKQYPQLNIVMLSACRDPKIVVDAMRAGALDYITKPLDSAKFCGVMQLVGQQTRTQGRKESSSEKSLALGKGRAIIFRSRKFQAIIQQADQLKGHHANVLITGETGTGKELLARYLHQIEGKSDRPFIAVNCAAIPDHLMETELFGAERGAYTGSHARRIGKFELADGGDIFLDEIGSLKSNLQAKILRVLQEKEFSRIGGSATIPTNFRVIAATNDKLEQMVSRNQFRLDLYHRLRVIEIHMPALRVRIDDIPLLVDHFLKKHALGPVKRMSSAAMEKLLAYYWPGNVRELENVIQSLVILCPEEMIDADHLPTWSMNGVTVADAQPQKMNQPSPNGAVEPLKNYLYRAESSYLQHVLMTTKGDKSKAAKVLDVGRTTLYSKLREYGLLE